MLEVLFNDEVSTLSFVHIPNQEALAIVDEDLKVYKTISYNPFEPSDQDLLDAWDNALHEYYDLDCEEVFSEWRISQAKKSNEAFSQWLEEDKSKREEVDDVG